MNFLIYPLLLLSTSVRACSAWLSPRLMTRQRLTMPRAAARPSDLSTGLSDFIDQYDSWLIDQWGVLFDATAPYPGVIEALEKLASMGKDVVLLSNSSKRRADAVRNLINKMKLGEPGGLYRDIITSGEVGHHYVISGQHPVMRPGSKVLCCGSGDGDADYVEGMGCSLADGPEDCDWILARGNFVVVTSTGQVDVPAGTIEDNFSEQTAFFMEESGPLFLAAQRGVPMLVTNPDMIRPGTNSPMPGRIGAIYASEGLGGNVHYVGKPYGAVYDEAFKSLQNRATNRQRTVMVGDAMPTDVLGGKRNGCVGTVLVAHGIHAHCLGVTEGGSESPEEHRISSFLEQYAPDERPTHIVPAFRL